MTRCTLLLAGGLLAIGACGARADDVAADRLDALLERAVAQRERIDSLEAQLAAQAQPAVEAQRAKLLRAQIREVLGGTEFREQLMPASLQAGYDRGFFIRSSDGNFSIRFNGRMQLRYTHTNLGDQNRYLVPGFHRDDRSGLDAQRIRLTVQGNAVSPNLTYYVQFRSGVDGDYKTRLRDAYVNYRFDDALQFQAGMFKAAATLAELTSSANLQLVDRPIWNDVYGFGRGLGVRLWGTLAERRYEYYVDVLNALGAERNRTITEDPAELDGVPAVVFRFVWNALGDEPGRDLAHEADLEFHTTPALLFAFHYAFNDDNGDADTLAIPFPAPGLSGTPGGFGLTSTAGLQIHQFGLASAFKYRGFSTRGEYVVRLVDPRETSVPPVAPWFQLTGDDSTTAQHGGYVQCGYFLPIPGFERKIEVVGRVGVISALASELELAWEYAGGVNYYIRGDNVKLQADVTKVPESPVAGSSTGVPNVNDEALVVRVQLQVAF